MSNTPPDRKEAGDASEGPKSPWVSWLVWAILVPVLYVLSIGPANRLHSRGIWKKPIEAVYEPLSYLPEDWKGPIRTYASWWNP